MSQYGVISDPHFPVFGLNTKIYSANLRIQSEYRKMRTRKNSVFELFSHSESALLIGVWRSCFTTDLKFNHVISKRFSIYTLKSCGNPHSCYSVSIYLFKVNNGNTRKMREIQVPRFQHLNGNETKMPDETGSGDLLWK